MNTDTARRRGAWLRLLVSVGLLMAAGASSAAEKIGGGHAAFMENCAVCHGSDGMGSGPFTSMLRVAPPNLTVLAQMNGGEFPDKRVRRTLEGFNMPGAHGNNEMPIWGRRWREGGAGSVGAQARVIAVIAYLRTIQR